MFIKHWLLFHLIIAFILIFVFILEFKIVGQSVYGDARYYLSYTRSIYYSQNIDITDEMAHDWSPEGNNRPSNSNSVPELQKYIDVTTHNFSLGISIIWIPIYFVADILAIIFSKFDSSIIRNGYSDIYQIVLGIGNIFFVVSGLFLLSKILLKFFSKEITALSIILILFSTNLFYYSAIDVVNTHPFSFFGTSLLIYLYFKFKENKKFKIIFMQGIILGLMTASRMQDALLILIPILTIINNFNFKKFKLRKNYIKLFILAAGILISYLPQLLIMYLGQGKILLIPHLSKAENDFLPFSHFTDVLFDPKQGIAIYMPLMLISMLGLFMFRKKNKDIGFVFIMISLLVFLLISSYDGWNVAGYTARYFISIFPILIFGIAEIIIFVKKKYSSFLLYLLTGIFIVHQGLSIISFKLFWQDPTFVGDELSSSGQLKNQILEIISRYLQL